MCIFWFIPCGLFVVAFLYETVWDAIRRYREENPYIGHLNYRDNRVGRYYTTRH